MHGAAGFVRAGIKIRKQARKCLPLFNGVKKKGGGTTSFSELSLNKTSVICVIMISG